MATEVDFRVGDDQIIGHLRGGVDSLHHVEVSDPAGPSRIVPLLSGTHKRSRSYSSPSFIVQFFMVGRVLSEGVSSSIAFLIFVQSSSLRFSRFTFSSKVCGAGSVAVSFGSVASSMGCSSSLSGGNRV